MFDHIFDTPFMLITGALTGLIFGFLLQKGAVTRYQTILGQFLLKDFTVAKVMGSAIVVGAIGIYGMLALGVLEPAQMHIKGTTLLANALGGAIFGVGMALLGFCPGTGVAAMGDGSRDAIFGVFGMLFGAAVYAEMYPWLKANILSVGDFGKLTLPEAVHIPTWFIIAALALGAGIGFAMLERHTGRNRHLAT